MANPLESYVENFILNPGRIAKFDDSEDDDATLARVSDKIKGPEGKEGAGISASKLRIKNAPLLSDRDPRYKTKKVTRNSLRGSKENEVEFDPQLSKYFLFDENDDEVSNKEESEESLEEESDLQYSEPLHSMPFDESNISYNDEIEESDLDDIEEESDDEEKGIESLDSGCEDEGGFGNKVEPQTKTISADDYDLAEKASSVKNQIGLYDSLFEFRIALQKILISANRLPQHEKYNIFLKEDNGLYKKNLQAARTSTKRLLGVIVDLQETLLLKNPEMRYISTSEQQEQKQDSDEEIPSDEDQETTEKESLPVAPSKKKKRKLEDLEETLSKRHKAFESFRDTTLLRWHEKVKLLFGHNNRDKFKAFDVSPVQQLTNLLANKEELVKRTQLVGVSRGNTFRVLGQQDNIQAASLDGHDPEIFDDGDFYSRLLEEVLKSKMSLSSDMTDVSRRWIEIQNLRKRSKKKVDTKASKGRKIRYEVMSKLQQYMAPCKPPTIDDGAINMLFGSLFGNSLKS